MKKLVKSLGKSILEAFAKNEYFVHWRKKYPTIFNFLEKRFSFANPYGFYFSIGIILSAIALFYFFVLIQDVIVKDPFVEADIRIMNLVAALRSMAVVKIFLLFTYLGNWQFIISLGAIIAIALVLLKEKRKLAFLIIGFVGGELLSVVFKLLMHRARPDIGFSLVSQSGYAFPSGHAAMSLIFYGMICYGFLKVFKKQWLKLSLVILAVTLIFFISFSRIYLGVHWVSDILAGWAIGIAFLILLITFFKHQERFKPETKTRGVLPKKSVIIIVIFLLIFEGVFFCYFYSKHPAIEPNKYQPEIIAISSSVNFPAVVLADNFPKFSETIVGDKMEPISFIIIGQKEQVVKIFKNRGWFVSDEPNRIKNLYQLAVAAIFNRPYPTAPVTPSFLNTQPNIIAFEKPTAANTVRQRHHARFWLTNFQQNGVPVWVATASFDDGLRYFITHKIHPDIDTERDFIKNELAQTGLIKDEKQIQLLQPLLGKNQSGDQFFTDGKAYIIFLN